MAMPLRKRDEITKSDTWDLEVLFRDTAEWEVLYAKIEQDYTSLKNLEGSISEDTAKLLEIFTAVYSVERACSKLYIYAMLKFSEDGTNAENQELRAKAEFLLSKVEEASAFFTQELCALSDEFLNSLLSRADFADYRQAIVLTIRRKPHILSLNEEKLLAQQSLYSGGFKMSFSALTDADFRFGSVKTAEGEIELTHSTFGLLSEHSDRAVRKEAHEKYFTVYKQHIQVLTQLYSNSIKQDCVFAQIRKFPSALEASLYELDIPVQIYQNLIDCYHAALPELHDYFSMLKQQSKLEDFATYDIRAPFFEKPPHNMSYEEAVDLVCSSLAPLGSDYVNVMRRGLTEDRWVDRYESMGKRSGGFSASVYDSNPYILLNYQPQSLDHVFTLAHEAGHSMHSYYSNKSNPYPMSEYSIFEAEVASTVNEYLLYRYLVDTNTNVNYKAYFLWHELQNIIALFFYQTMYAEVELRCHQQIEQGKALSSQFFLELGEELIHKHFGPAVNTTEFNSLFILRIPHFYRAFYVFQYATGVSSALAIGPKLYTNDADARASYFDFLKSGGSRFPVNALQLAGVDYRDSTPIELAIAEFTRKKNELKQYIS